MRPRLRPIPALRRQRSSFVSGAARPSEPIPYRKLQYVLTVPRWLVAKCQQIRDRGGEHAIEMPIGRVVALVPIAAHQRQVLLQLIDGPQAKAIDVGRDRR